jgi:ATP-dependent Clp protease adapter protein ClpS
MLCLAFRECILDDVINKHNLKRAYSFRLNVHHLGLSGIIGIRQISVSGNMHCIAKGTRQETCPPDLKNAVPIHWASI